MQTNILERISCLYKMEYVKRIITKGVGVQRPTHLAKVVLNILGVAVSSQGVNLEFDRRELFPITVGEACDELSETLETCICTMLVGEKCQMELRGVEYVHTADGIHVLRKNAELSRVLYTIQLVTLDYVPGIWELDTATKLQLAQRFKELGNARYKQSLFLPAAVLYAKGLRYVISIVPADKETEAVLTMRSAMLLNLSACQVKLGYYEAVVKNCSKVLQRDSNCVKALYRRGVALTVINDLDLASEDLKRAEQLSPHDLSVKEQISILNAKLHARNTQLRASLKRMFQ